MAVPVPVIDEKTLHMGFRPVYETYVDAVIEHLGGKSFRETAEEGTAVPFLKSSATVVLEQGQTETEKGHNQFPPIF